VWRLFHITIVRFNGARPAARRIVLFFVNYRHYTVPVKFSYYFKYHGACTAFWRVIEGTIKSAEHRLHRLHTWEGHRTLLVWNSNQTIFTAAGHRTIYEKSKELSKISIQIGRCPSGHWPMFYELNCHRWEETCICRSTYWICIIDISLVKTKNLIIYKLNYICFAWGAKDE